MVFPSIRSFQEITLLNANNIYKIPKESTNNCIRSSESFSRASKISSKKTFRKIISKQNNSYQYPIAS